MAYVFGVELSYEITVRFQQVNHFHKKDRV